MNSLRKRLTYANVMSSIAVFMVLGGGAYALGRLPRHSVGVEQLRAGAITAAKLHKNAVTNPKIRYGAVDGGKIADGSVTGSDINAASTPFGRVTARLRGVGNLALTAEEQIYALNPSTYTQAADEVDSYYGALDIAFQPGCLGKRSATAYIVVEATNPVALQPTESIVAAGSVEDESGGTLTKRIEIGPYELHGSRFEPGTPKSHAVNLVVRGTCETGSGIAATFGGVDVIGIR